MPQVGNLNWFQKRSQPANVQVEFQMALRNFKNHKNKLKKPTNENGETKADQKIQYLKPNKTKQII